MSSVLNFLEIAKRVINRATTPRKVVTSKTHATMLIMELWLSAVTSRGRAAAEGILCENEDCQSEKQSKVEM